MNSPGQKKRGLGWGALFLTKFPPKYISGGDFASSLPFYASRRGQNFISFPHWSGWGCELSPLGPEKKKIAFLRKFTIFWGGNFTGYDAFLRPVGTYPITRCSKPAAPRRFFLGQPWRFGCKRRENGQILCFLCVIFELRSRLPTAPNFEVYRVRPWPKNSTFYHSRTHSSPQKCDFFLPFPSSTK